MTQITDALIERKVQPEVLYYVKEGKVQHPLFDLFFLCQFQGKKTLFIIDITSDDVDVAEEKLERMFKWIGEQKLENFAIKGFIFAPGAAMDNKSHDSNNAAIIGQKEALVHLGVLRQLFRWFLEDEETILTKE